MKIGLSMFCTDDSMRIDDVAREAEARGFESLCVPEHTHIPTSRKSPWPGGGDLPREYSHTLDPFVGLMAAAAVTKKLRVITGIALLTERDPIVSAKESATLDYLSNGRFELGIGAGWNAEEMENHGTEFKHRFKVMCERAKAMRALWTDEEAQFHGRFVDFDPVWSYPKPVQDPLPILLGGETKYSLQRVVDFCDGWLPRSRSFADPKAEVARLAAVAEDNGRDMNTINISVFAAPPDAKVLESYREAGVYRALLGLPPAGSDVVLRKLDEFAKLL